MDLKRFAESVFRIQSTHLRTDSRAAGNTGLAKVAVQCPTGTFAVNQTLVFRINICGENRHLRQARNRWRSCREPRTNQGKTFRIKYATVKNYKIKRMG